MDVNVEDGVLTISSLKTTGEQCDLIMTAIAKSACVCEWCGLLASVRHDEAHKFVRRDSKSGSDRYVACDRCHEKLRRDFAANGLVTL